MKTLLRIYLILIFASSALNAGSENDSITRRSGLMMEASNFALKSSYPQNLEGIATCMNSARQKEYKTVTSGIEDKESAQ